MKRLSFAIGTMLLLLIAGNTAEAKPLYDLIREDMEKEVGKENIDEEVAEYVAAFHRETWKLTKEEVEKILQGKFPKVCGDRETTDPAHELGSCDRLVDSVRALAENEARIRTLGRSMQATATSYELPISDLPERTLKLSADLRGILNIWSAGTGSVKSTITGALIRTISADQDTFRPLMTTIGEKLNELKREEREAAVWRYQYGVRLVNDDRAPRFPAPFADGQSGPGTERQYLFKHWEDLEETLMAIWDEIKNDTFDPPLSTQETVYFTFGKDLRDETLPDNILLWARIDGNANNGFPFGDVGLQWQTPLHPVMPSLLDTQSEESKLILGGRYPPEPVTSQGPTDGRGLCTNPLAMRGYLCRPFIVIGPKDRCPTPSEFPPDSINLVHCTHTGSLRFSASGPDVCREINWKDGQPFDPQTQCKLKVTCADTCTFEGVSGSAVTYPKKADGTVEVCMQNEPPNPATYLLYHELVHAYQSCTLPPGNPRSSMTKEQKNAHCCRIEGEAYRASCDVMERDGVFAGSIAGITANGETCAEALTNESCEVQQSLGKCYTSLTYPRAFTDGMLSAINNNPKNVPASCTDAIDPKKMDPRLQAFKESIERRNDVCRPGEQTTYKNRIGNNLCYLGQCVEQSTELHRIAGGRTPAGVSDEAAPWDSPMTGTPLANIFMNPPLLQGKIPLYRPELLVREMETALCQLQGLPPRTPPVLCTVDAKRQFELPQSLGLDIALGLLKQQDEQQLSTNDLMRLSPALGARIGTNIYSQYLREGSRSFAGVLTIAKQMMEDIKKIEFPEEMCPIYPALPNP